MTNVDDIINGIDTLKPIPPVATQIMALAEDENSSMSDIAELIVHDPSITASLLKICNSAHFGVSHKVESVRDAITLLGLDQIVELVLLNGTAQNFRDEPDGYGLGAQSRCAETQGYLAEAQAAGRRRTPLRYISEVPQNPLASQCL